MQIDWEKEEKTILTKMRKDDFRALVKVVIGYLLISSSVFLMFTLLLKIGPFVNEFFGVSK